MSLCHPPRHDSAHTIQRGFESWVTTIEFNVSFVKPLVVDLAKTCLFGEMKDLVDDCGRETHEFWRTVLKKQHHQRLVSNDSGSTTLASPPQPAQPQHRNQHSHNERNPNEPGATPQPAQPYRTLSHRLSKHNHNDIQR